MVWRLVRNSIELIIYVEPSFMQVCAPQLSRAHCIFAQITKKNDFIESSIRTMNNNRFQTLLLAGWAKIQWARDN